jgi:hypothetical protein
MNPLIERTKVALSLLCIALFTKEKKHKCLIEEGEKAASQPPAEKKPPPPSFAPKQKEQKEQVYKEQEQKEQIQETQEIQPTIVPYIHTLSERQTKAEERSLEGMCKLLEKHGVGVAPNHIPSVNMPWHMSIPHIVIITAYITGTPKELFLQKVAVAVEERLGKKVLIAQPSHEIAAKLTAFASTNRVQAIILAYDQTNKKQIYSWLGIVPIRARAAQNSSLQFESSRQLFSTPIYDLEIPQDGEHDASFKARLWKALQSL